MIIFVVYLLRGFYTYPLDFPINLGFKVTMVIVLVSYVYFSEYLIMQVTVSIIEKSFLDMQVFCLTCMINLKISFYIKQKAELS